MSEYYSSEVTITQKMSSNRIVALGDKESDGSMSSGVLTQALSFAKSRIDVMLLRRYGDVVNTWTSATVPKVLQHISDDITIYYLAAGNNAMNPIIESNYALAIQDLQALRDGLMDIPGLDDSDGDIQTETSESIFDDFTEKYAIKDRGELL